VPDPAVPHHAIPGEIPAAAAKRLLGNTSHRRAIPRIASPYHTEPSNALHCLALPCPAVLEKPTKSQQPPLDGYWAMPSLASASDALPGQATPCPAQPRLAIAVLPRTTQPCHTLPNHGLPAEIPAAAVKRLLGNTLQYHAIPRNAQHYLAPQCLAIPNLALRYHASPPLGAPCRS